MEVFFGFRGSRGYPRACMGKDRGVHVLESLCIYFHTCMYVVLGTRGGSQTFAFGLFAPLCRDPFFSILIIDKHLGHESAGAWSVGVWGGIALRVLRPRVSG